jgi:hypothetical protein
MRGAHQLFVEMSRLLEANAGAFLCVTVTHMLYRGTEEVRHQVYHVYGADNLVVFARAGYVEALVGFLSGGDAEQARPPMDLVTAFPGRRGRGTGTWYGGRLFSKHLGTVSTQRKDVPNQFGS